MENNERVEVELPAGEKELRLAFEEATRKNVNATISHSNKTRELLREMEVRIDSLQNNILTFQGEIVNIKKQIGALQAMFYGGGSTSGE